MQTLETGKAISQVKVPTGTSSLYLRDILLPQAELLVKPENVLAN